MREMLVPDSWQGLNHNCVGEMKWLAELPTNTFCSLWRNWFQTEDLPIGHDLYVISYHLDAIDIEWVIRQCDRIQQPIILLSDAKYYDLRAPKNLYCFTYLYWHQQMAKMQRWFPEATDKNIIYKVSAVCHRITQSKLLIHTVLAEIYQDDALLILGDWIDGHSAVPEVTGNVLIDHTSSIFWSKYFGRIRRIDGFDNSKNYQKYTADPWTAIYQQTGLHCTNESFHYSLMETPGRQFIYPGPFLTEKTFKCLLGATGFISVGQFETYRTLQSLGFEFDYGIDLSFDSDPGNLSRMEKIIKLLLDLKKFSAQELFDLTRTSSLYNQDHILSGRFAEQCEKVNFVTRERIMDLFGR